MISEYLQYKSKVAETLTEIFLKKTGHIVERIGGEEVLSTLFNSGIINTAKASNQYAGNVTAHLMKQFDFAAFSVDKNTIQRAYFLDVKCWDFSEFDNGSNDIGTKAFVTHEVAGSTSLYKQAKKYDEVFSDSSLFIFAIVKNGDNYKCEILYETINKIIEVGEASGDKKIMRLCDHRWTMFKNKSKLTELEEMAQMLCVGKDIQPKSQSKKKEFKL